MEWNGNIISGAFDDANNEFSIKSIKHFSTESTLNPNQLNQLYTYLDKHKDESDGQIVTLYDQLLVRLSQDEIKQLIDDLNHVKDLYQ
ncbi:hypothetical protein [Radiobacillus sp. PE A8.2]|uniref:hypothetical protein n=1 Tax=Radiobacillus sp. PE A8.2 TaxID=3380349 RepID=UPI00388D8D54